MNKLYGLAVGFMLFLTACGTGPHQGPPDTGGGVTTPPPGSLSSVNHIIIMMQENRSTDHYFAKINEYRAAHGLGAADFDVMNLATTTQKTWDGSASVTPFHMNTMCTVNLSSAWVEAHVQMDTANPSAPADPPPMDGFVYTAGGFCAHTGCWDTIGTRALGYYTDADLPFYYWGATQFATSDRWFSAAPSRTQINRIYLLAATSEGHAYPPTDKPPFPNIWNLKAKTIFQLLEEHGITWRVYVTSGLGNATTPAGATYMNYYPGFTNTHLANFVPATQFATDAANGTLPQVALIESGYENGLDEHPDNNVQVGAAYAHDMVSALIGSPAWKDSVFFLTYDEAGGLYDHVPPMKTVSPDGIPPVDIIPGDATGDFTVSGFRVPLIIFSPFAKRNYVSHTPMDFTAMLKFIEERFTLPPLTQRDAAQPSMQEFFDFATSPNLNPGPIQAQPTTGPCYMDSLP